MNDFNDWEEVKEYLEHSQDPDDFTTIRAYGVTGYRSKGFMSCGVMDCCWESFQCVGEAIENFQIHCKDITKVYKDD